MARDNVVVTKVPCLRSDRWGRRLCQGSLTHERVPVETPIPYYVCGHCSRIYGVAEFEALERAMVSKPPKPRPTAYTQTEMFP